MSVEWKQRVLYYFDGSAELWCMESAAWPWIVGNTLELWKLLPGLSWEAHVGWVRNPYLLFSLFPPEFRNVIRIESSWVLRCWGEWRLRAEWEPFSTLLHSHISSSKPGLNPDGPCPVFHFKKAHYIGMVSATFDLMVLQTLNGSWNIEFYTQKLPSSRLKWSTWDTVTGVLKGKRC